MPGQNGRHFTDGISKCIYTLTSYTPWLVQQMAGRRTGDRSLTEPMMTQSMTHMHICVPGFNQLTQHKSRQRWINGRSEQCLWLTGSKNTSFAHSTQRDWNKMASVLQTTFSNIFSWTKNLCTLTQVSLKFVLRAQLTIDQLISIRNIWSCNYFEVLARRMSLSSLNIYIYISNVKLTNYI